MNESISSITKVENEKIEGNSYSTNREHKSSEREEEHAVSTVNDSTVKTSVRLRNLYDISLTK